jgi:type IV pilus assembly protein PilQ
MTKEILKILMCLTMISFGASCASTGEDAADDSAAEELTSDEVASAATEDAAPAESAAADEPAAAAANNEEQTENELEEFGDEDFAKEEQAPEEGDLLEETTEEAPKETVAEEPPPQEPIAEEAPAESITITAINYLASANGGTVEIKTSGPATYNVRPNPNTNQYVIEIENATLSESLKRPYIMKDFEGSFGAINAYQNPGGRTARIVVQLKNAGEPVVSQEGNSLLVMPPGEVAPTTNVAEQTPSGGVETLSNNTDSESYDVKAATDSEKILGARTLDEFLTGSGRFFGRPISIQTNDADIRDVIQFIAEESGVNLVIADDVEGKVSVKLRQVPWDQALVIVMRSRGLGYVRQGNVLRITKLATLQAEATAAKDIVDSQKKLTPLKVKVMPVSYAQVSDLEKQVKPFLSSDRGQVVSDPRTSSLIITDTPDVLSKVERLVKELDIPPAQVMIEGKIVEAGESFSRTVGLNWSLSGTSEVLAGGAGNNGSDVRFRTGLNIQTLTGTQTEGSNGLFNLRIGSFGYLGSLNAALGLAQADSLIKIISSPRIVTINKEKAEISQKGEVVSLVPTVSPEGKVIGQTATKTPVELKLEVTPQITSEGSVILDVSVLRQFAGPEVETSTKARAINSRSAKTKVLVPNGQTAVIGGIYQSDESESENGVPGLKNIPILGWLFKQKTNERVKNELLIFLTPRVLNSKDQAAVN